MKKSIDENESALYIKHKIGDRVLFVRFQWAKSPKKQSERVRFFLFGT